MAAWGLYGALPPPSTGSTPTPSTPNSNVNNNNSNSEWTSDPKLAKMMPTAIRKKAVLMVPRSTHVQVPKAKVQKTTTETKPQQIIDKTPMGNTDNSSLVSPAYAVDAVHPVVEVEEEYDPARPNEYDKYVADRRSSSQNNNNNNMDDDFDENMHEDEREWERPPHPREEPKPTVDLTISGEEAFNRRRAISQQRAPSPPRPSYTAEEDIDGEAIDDTPPAPVAPPSSGPRESVAARMMARMGWKEGAGLGKSEQGMTTALVHKKTNNKTGVIVNAPPTFKQAPAPAPAPPPVSRPNVHFPPPQDQSRVILLKNMVGPGEVDDELEAETASECGKYGEKCLIYEVVGGIVEPQEAVRIFIQFTRQESAVKAYIDLNGRFFGGRAVNASFFNEERFMTNDLAPTKEEMEQ